MLAEVTGLIGGEDLKPDLAQSRWQCCLPLEQTRLARISHAEFIRNLISINPLSPYFETIRIPETSGSDGASSKHPDFSLYRNRLSSLEALFRRGARDVHDQPVQFDDDSFS